MKLKGLENAINELIMADDMTNSGRSEFDKGGKNHKLVKEALNHLLAAESALEEIAVKFSDAA